MYINDVLKDISNERFWNFFFTVLFSKFQISIVCGSSKPQNVPIKIDISDSPQSPHKKRTRRYM